MNNWVKKADEFIERQGIVSAEFCKIFDRIEVKIQALQKENVELQRKLDLAVEALGFYASFETQYDDDIDPPQKLDGDGYPICDYDYSQGKFKQFGKRARRALNEIGEER